MRPIRSCFPTSPTTATRTSIRFCLIGTAPYLTRRTARAKPFQYAGRRHRRRQGEARRHQLCLGRQRQCRPSGDGAAVATGRRKARARALSRRRTGDDRRPRRPRRSPRRQHGAVDAAESTPDNLRAVAADRQDPQSVPGRRCRPRVESGFPGFEAYAWWGIFAPAGTPKPIIERFAQRNGRMLCATRACQQQCSLETQQVVAHARRPRRSCANSSPSQMAVWGTGCEG